MKRTHRRVGKIPQAFRNFDSPNARERRACLEILDKLGSADLKDATYAHALDVFGDINKKLGARPLKPWNVELDHRDGSTLRFMGAFLIEIDGWLGCFTRNHGFHIYRVSDLKRYDCRVSFYPKKPDRKETAKRS